MKKIIFIVLIFGCFNLKSFSQLKRIEIVISSQIDEGEPAYEKTVLDFITQHLKKLPQVAIGDTIVQMTYSDEQLVVIKSGEFYNPDFSKSLKEKSVDYTVIVTYSVFAFEDPTSKTKEQKTKGYIGNSKFQVQIINAANNQILNSLFFFESQTTVLDTKPKTYKTKEDAIRASLENCPQFYHYFKNIDDYFEKTFSFTKN